MTPEMLQAIYLIIGAAVGWAIKHFFGGSPAPAPVPVAPVAVQSGAVDQLVGELRQHVADQETAAVKAALVKTVMSKTP